MNNYLINFPFVILTIVAALWSSSVRAKGTQYVTCGSALKLLNVDYKVTLHTHDMKYGTGSGQQSVTGLSPKENGNSYWLVKGPTNKQCTRGEPVKCGDIIRLEHIGTRKNLHSHSVSSPLSGKQEISAYGDSKGEGDNGDNWVLICDNESLRRDENELWRRDSHVMLKHVDTSAYLAVSGRIYGHPINGQSEVVGEHSVISPHCQWISTEGVFTHPHNLEAQHSAHTEL
ncbi:stromal cell-derived factor 2 [Halictus rubicundus]|uniref:stromal cell-derived factor 2 n=1 Tax=Halictus rubicundus TaxID=77578 RepID=UPI0040354DCC